jgi:N-acetylglucosamine kinase-like BadF-type ATPase
VADAIHAAVATRQVLVTSDVVTGYCGAVGLSEGVVVAAGTGVITLAVGPLRVARVDGWGWILGDAGSGYDIGRRGLDAALRAHDGRGGSAALAELAARAIGPLDDLVRLVYGEANPVRLVAGFAEQVAAAARAGDPIARRIWADAAAELATSAVAAVDRAGLDLERIPLSWTGGLFSAEDLLLEPFLARATATRPALIPQAPAGTALEGAYRLATATPGGPLDALVYRAPAQPAGRDPENPEGVPR